MATTLVLHDSSLRRVTSRSLPSTSTADVYDVEFGFVTIEVRVVSSVCEFVVDDSMVTHADIIETASVTAIRCFIISHISFLPIAGVRGPRSGAEAAADSG